LGRIAIQQYHIGEEQPTEYLGKDISKIIFYYIMFPHTKEWALDKMDIHFKDGSMKSEGGIKVWTVALGITGGHGSSPVGIEQRFEQK